MPRHDNGHLHCTTIDQGKHMQAGSLLHLPRRLKQGIAMALSVGFIASSAFLATVMVRNPVDPDLLAQAISLFQFVATGLALALIAFFSTKNISTAELLLQTSHFLVDEMPKAFRSSLIVRSMHEQAWSVSQTVDEVSTTVVKTDHVQGSASAAYLVEAFGSKIKLRITLNAFRFVVLYYIPLHKHTVQDVEKAIDLVLEGATTVDYKYRIATNTSLEGSGSLIEIYFYRTTEKDLLLDSSSRLFWSQDIAVMTKSMVLQLQRGGISLDDGSPTPD